MGEIRMGIVSPDILKSAPSVKAVRSVLLGSVYLQDGTVAPIEKALEGTDDKLRMTPFTTRAVIDEVVGSAGKQSTEAFATAEQGQLAENAVQKNEIGTAAHRDVDDFATATQGELAETAVQPQHIGSAAKQPVEAFATASQGQKAETAVQVGTIGTAAQKPAEFFATADERETIKKSLAQTNADVSGLAGAVQAAAAGSRTAATWPILAAKAPDRDQQPGMVPDTDSGTHIDPVTGQTVPNAGEYQGVLPSSWRWVSANKNTERFNQIIPPSSDDSLFQALSSTSGGVMEIRPDARPAFVAADGKFSRLPRPEVIDRLDATGWDEYTGTIDTIYGSVSPASLTHIRNDMLTSAVLGIIGFGQSLTGSAQDDLTDLAITTVPSYPNNALMPFVGRKPRGVTFDSFVPAYEWNGTPSSATTESWATPMMNFVISNLYKKLGVMPTLVTAVYSEGARTWSQLGPGNDAWTHLTKGIRDMQRASEKMGKRFEVAAVPILWGEQNRSSAIDSVTIRTNYLDMVRRIKALVMEITGQKLPPLIVISVPANSAEPPLGDRDAPHMTVPASLHGVDGINVMNPNYIRTTTGNVHLKAKDYKDLGEDLGRVILEGWFGPGYGPLILQPERIRWASATRFILPCSVPKPPIVVDLTGTVVKTTPWGNAGFQLFDGRTGVEVPISAVTAVGGSGLAGDPIVNLQFDLAVAPNGAPRLAYAIRNDGTGNNAGNVTGARGCIRDSSTRLVDGVAVSFPKWALPIYTRIPAY